MESRDQIENSQPGLKKEEGGGGGGGQNVYRNQGRGLAEIGCLR